MKVLVVIDMQNDFITGSLANKKAQKIVPKVVEKVAKAIQDKDTKVLFTMDTHYQNYIETEEGKNLPIEHCISGTNGWEIIDELQPYLDNESITIYEKETFGSRWLAERIYDWGEQYNYSSKEIEIIGVCTDICVISNALLIKAFCPNVPIYIDAECCAGTTPEKHEAALQVMESCQIYQRK